MAKCYFDCKEYQRCASCLDKADAGDAKSLFLRNYALYLAGERRRHEEEIELAGSAHASGRGAVRNRVLGELERTLETLAACGAADAFCLYVFGLVLIDRQRPARARTVLRDSLAAYPCNWSAWKALQAACSEWDHVLELALPEHAARDCFLAAMCIELQCCEEALSRMHRLSGVFPRSNFLMLRAAYAHYDSRRMDEAAAIFEDVMLHDEFNLELLDIYSNILFMKEDFAALSHLAHKAVLVDKYRPETCCVIGNYCALKGHHEKAIVYFQRALRVNPNCNEAWTLIGHEFVELKKPAAAIAAYRRGVDAAPKDYRAWYGLGQTYEMLAMPYYALFYYRKAAQIRPKDARMWVAMGQCYSHEHLKQYAAAAKCYRQAVTSGDHEHIVLHKLAETYKIMKHDEAAFSCYKQNLAAIDQQNSTGQDAVDALTFLAEHCLRKGRLPDAEMYAMRLQDFGGAAKDRGRRVIDEVERRRCAPRAGATRVGGA